MSAANRGKDALMNADELSRVAMSSSLAVALARARDNARTQGHKEVTLEHMLLSLSDDPDAGLVLAASNVDVMRLRTDASRLLAALERQAFSARVVEPAVSENLRRILDAAAAAARGGRRREINGAIVLAAIVGDGKSPAAQLLQSQGLTFEGAIRALQRGAGVSRPFTSTEDILASARERVQSRTVPAGLSREATEAEEEFYTEEAEATPQDFEPEPAPAYEPEPEPDFDDVPPVMERRLPERLSEARPVPQPAPAPAPAPEVDYRSAPEPEPAPRPAPPRPAPSLSAIRRAPPLAPAPAPAPAPAAPPPAPPGAPRADVARGPLQDFELDYPVAPATPVGAPLPPPPLPGLEAAPSWTPPPNDAPGVEGYATGPGAPPPLPRQSAPAPQPAAAPKPSAPPPRLSEFVDPPHQRSAAAAGDSRESSAYATLTRGERGPQGTPASEMRPPSPTRPPAQRAEIGQLVENIPRTMRVAVPVLIEVRIARAEVQALAEGLQGGAAAYRHEVTVTKAMSVRLRAPDGGFYIETASPETQWIERSALISSDDYASWRWHVTPRDKGRRRLQLIISARTVSPDGLAAETALPDQVISVRVRTNYGRTVSRMLGWGIAAVAGGLFARFGEGAFDQLFQVIGRLLKG